MVSWVVESEIYIAPIRRVEKLNNVIFADVNQTNTQVYFTFYFPFFHQEQPLRATRPETEGNLNSFHQWNVCSCLVILTHESKSSVLEVAEIPGIPCGCVDVCQSCFGP